MSALICVLPRSSAFSEKQIPKTDPRAHRSTIFMGLVWEAVQSIEEAETLRRLQRQVLWVEHVEDLEILQPTA